MSQEGWIGLGTICLAILTSTSVIAWMIGGMKTSVKVLIANQKTTNDLVVSHKDDCNTDRAETRTTLESHGKRLDKHSDLIQELGAG